MKLYRGSNHECFGCTHWDGRNYDEESFMIENCSNCLKKKSNDILRVERPKVDMEEIKKRREERFEKEIEIDVQKQIRYEKSVEFKRKANRPVFKCNDCDVTCFSEEYMQAHLRGRKHKQKKKEQVSEESEEVNVVSEEIEVNIMVSEKDKYCEKCKKIISKTNWSKHLKSAKHLNGETIFTCKYCNINVCSRSAMEKHMKTKRHKLKENNSRVECEDPLLEQEEEEGDEGKKKKDRRGHKFFVRISKNCKYDICRKVKMYCCNVCKKTYLHKLHFDRHQKSRTCKILTKAYGKSRAATEYTEQFESKRLFSGLVIGNEYGLDGDSPHSHALFHTVQPYTYTEFSELLRKEFQCLKNVSIDVEGARNDRQCVRYITKEDRRAVIEGIDRDLTHSVYKAAKYAENNDRLNWGDYIPSTIAPCDRKVFEAVFLDEIEKRKNDIDRKNFENIELKEWQKKMIEILESGVGNDRKVTWVEDLVGNSGKTFLGKFLMATKDAVVFSNMIEKDVAYSYAGQPIVIFDISRCQDMETLNMNIVEHLKNGFIFSTKYESRIKEFKVPAVACFANNFPKKSKLSLDRWDVWSIVNGCLEKYECFNSVLGCKNEEHLNCGNT